MKISIITVSFNSEQTIEQTIQSVLSQSYPDVEYIVIDGQSNDGTLAIVNTYQDQIQTIRF
jgi:glycosyltransferase involved in cell wall biosynthesis